MNYATSRWKCALFALMTASAAHGETVLNPQELETIPPSLQKRIIVEEKGESKWVGLRYEQDHYRVIYQAFAWEQAAPLGGIGFKLTPNKNNLAEGAVNYQIRLFPVDGLAKGSRVGSLIEAYVFVVTGHLSEFSGYLYFELPSPAALDKGKSYLIEVTPMQAVVRRLTLATSGPGSQTYMNGAGFTKSVPDTGHPVELTGTPIGNYTFFLTTPNP